MLLVPPPAVDPLHALARERRRHQRRGHLAALSFVVLVLLAQRSKTAGIRFDPAPVDRPGPEPALASPEGSR